MAEGERLSASGSAESSTPTRHEPLPAARCGPAPATSTTATRTPYATQPLARPRETPSRAQTTSEVCKWKVRVQCRSLLCFRHNPWPLEGRQQACSQKSRKMRERARSTVATRRRTMGSGWPTPELPKPPERCRGRCSTRGGMDLGMCVSPRPGCRWRTWLPARSGLRSPARPLPRANGLCCWGHPGLVEVRRPQSAILVAAGRSGHLSDRRVPRRCGGTAARAGSVTSVFGSAGTVGALDLQWIGART